MFSKREVRLDTSCLDCGEPIVVRMKNGEVLESSPETVVGHVNLPLPEVFKNPAYG